MAIGSTRSIGRFQIVPKKTYASYGEVYRNSLSAKHASAISDATTALFGTITTQSAGLFKVAIQQALARTKAQMASTLTSVIDLSV